MPKTLLDKIWEQHIVLQEADSPAILYIDRHLFHEVTSPQAFSVLRENGWKIRNPNKYFGVIDHSIPTENRGSPSPDPIAQKQIETCEKNAEEFGLHLEKGTDENQGITHVAATELGIIQPGMTAVCGDSHTSTLGAFAALAFGIGTSEVGHVFATQCLLQNKPKSYEVYFEERMGKGITAKDSILALIARIGIGGGTGYVFEYRGPGVKDISMEGRMTICNMSIEAGARAGMFAADEITFEYLKEKKYAPQNEEWDKAMERWKQCISDEGAKFDKSINIHFDKLEPMVSFGVNPGMSIGISEKTPRPEDMESKQEQEELTNALEYMGLNGGDFIEGTPIDYVFLGSCTNARIEDFRLAANILKGKKVASEVTVLVVPGSYNVKRQAEKEGLDKIFKEAGCQWREPGCSMCLSMSPDRVPAGKRCASTSNRNFKGRQGPGSRTHLMSPLSAAAAAIAGKIVDPREYIK